MKIKRKIYAEAVKPEKYPLYKQRNAKAVTRRQLGDKIRFMALRWFDTDDNGNLLNFTAAFDRYTREFDLGDVMWPMYPTLFAGNFREFAEEAARRGMYMMDFGAYVPGSNPSRAVSGEKFSFRRNCLIHCMKLWEIIFWGLPMANRTGVTSAGTPV